MASSIVGIGSVEGPPIESTCKNKLTGVAVSLLSPYNTFPAVTVPFSSILRFLPILIPPRILSLEVGRE